MRSVVELALTGNLFIVEIGLLLQLRGAFALLRLGLALLRLCLRELGHKGTGVYEEKHVPFFHGGAIGVFLLRDVAGDVGADFHIGRSVERAEPFAGDRDVPLSHLRDQDIGRAGGGLGLFAIAGCERDQAKGGGGNDPR